MQRLSQLLSGAYLLLAALITAITLLNGPLGAAPFPLALGTSRTPIVVQIDYSTEKKAWLEEAVRRFSAENRRVRGRPIQIQLNGVGSREIVTQIVDGRSRPTVISPASSIQTELLRRQWQARGNTEILLAGADAPRPLVLTPLVLVSWRERGALLWPQGVGGDFWQRLHTAVADPKGWAAIGHPDWGYVKFGHTSPETSNSGVQTLLLMAYAYHTKGSDLSLQDVSDPGFQRWLGEIESSQRQFGESTGTLMDDLIRYGPSRYDVVALYENLALESIQRTRARNLPDLQIFYPPATLLSDHPYAILNAPWVDADQRAAAALFRDFLLAAPAQQLALQYGFRPANSEVLLDPSDPNNPFVKYQSNGAQLDIQQQAALPTAEVLDALIEQWRRRPNQ